MSSGAICFANRLVIFSNNDYQNFPYSLNDSFDQFDVLRRVHSLEFSSDEAFKSKVSFDETSARPTTLTIVLHADSTLDASGIIQRIRSLAGMSAFIVLWHPEAVESPSLRIQAFINGANMVTCNENHLKDVLGTILAMQGTGQVMQAMQGTGQITCHVCGQQYMTAQDLWYHMPLFHIYHPNFQAQCQICHEHVDNMQVHVHEEHGPSGPCKEVRCGIGAAVVVHRCSDNKFLMVQEFANQGYWLPGGMMDGLQEPLTTCAVRECLEEVGMEVEVKGLLQIQHDMSAGKQGWRLVTFYAQLKEEAKPSEAKTVPDFESAGSCWVSAEELDHVPLRSETLPRKWFPLLSQQPDFVIPPLKIPDHLEHLFRDVTL
ncbi:hypothetical protein CEUSTIGMA_g6485.t1 [Chlamydomonas eustigma]|uniref:Nudix hydrolase domain-containing protein n=1 Tax=Chlamydomonas eustigma TaxID=1157962 RepID=A0A250X7K9_9CHLO|nr:hypothetical protein CEUSTIGMA_g6485.t1 [Chlamydomonas eustigma]|eukprot:GAX79045.1 hypothetical protein CEUSTIGMA_g6485.t1 [Chlamydomonas eustigma]